VALGPIFASRTHGYDTTDHYRIDSRLGDDTDFDYLIEQAHGRGLLVLLDGVFNHVGVDFPRYHQALEDDSAAGWFRGDRGAFHTFEGHPELVTLDHNNPEVADYTVDVLDHWIRRGADGWRLDAAYAVPQQFWADVVPRVHARHPQAWFVGELIHGDYAAAVAETGLDSVTQYELWKAIWSSLNDANFYELDWTLQRHNTFLESFAPLTFIGNHDVTRIASRLDHPDHLAQALVILMTVGGVPSIYAGDEFGYRGIKEERAGGDDAIRPEFDSPPSQLDARGAEIYELHRYLIGLRRRHPWLHAAFITALLLDNRHYIYRTHHDDEALIVALNVDDAPLPVVLPDLGTASAQVVAGTAAPPPEVVCEVTIEPHGWRILRPV
jgi:glycosidase